MRGGASTSHLTPYFGASDPTHEQALFHGDLDTRALGGAGFASQRTVDEPGRVWDLRGYEGVEVEWAEGDGKVYTLVLKDEVQGERGDGRARSGVCWEVEVRCVGEGGRMWLPWEGFRPTYRGREWPGAGELKTGGIVRVGVMMRSFFGEQEGPFRVLLKSVCAVKGGGDGGGEGEGEGGANWDEKRAGGGGREVEAEKEAGWGEWLAGMCVVS